MRVEAIGVDDYNNNIIIYELHFQYINADPVAIL